jgi:sentrin-specific protease 8
MAGISDDEPLDDFVTNKVIDGLVPSSISPSFQLCDDDLQLLRPHGWLNDQCVEFWWDHVVQFNSKLRETDDGLIFICPSVMHMMKFLTAEDFGVLGDLKLNKKNLVLMPINNNETEGVGGSHWALLCFHRSENRFYFYDSCNNFNLGCAKAVTGKMVDALEVKNTTSLHIEQSTPQQANGTDCGLHMLLMAELVGKYWIKWNTMPNASALKSVTAELASTTRRALNILARRK